MPCFEVKVTSTVINHCIEAETEEEAIAIVMGDLSTRFAAYTEVVTDSTIIEITPGTE